LSIGFAWGDPPIIFGADNVAWAPPFEKLFEYQSIL
jgi:hypothetical protein